MFLILRPEISAFVNSDDDVESLRLGNVVHYYINGIYITSLKAPTNKDSHGSIDWASFLDLEVAFLTPYLVRRKQQ